MKTVSYVCINEVFKNVLQFLTVYVRKFNFIIKVFKFSNVCPKLAEMKLPGHKFMFNTGVSNKDLSLHNYQSL